MYPSLVYLTTFMPQRQYHLHQSVTAILLRRPAQTAKWRWRQRRWRRRGFPRRQPARTGYYNAATVSQSSSRCSSLNACECTFGSTRNEHIARSTHSTFAGSQDRALTLTQYESCRAVQSGAHGGFRTIRRTSRCCSSVASSAAVLPAYPAACCLPPCPGCSCVRRKLHTDRAVVEHPGPAACRPHEGTATVPQRGAAQTQQSCTTQNSSRHPGAPEDTHTDVQSAIWLCNRRQITAIRCGAPVASGAWLVATLLATAACSL